MSAPRRAVDDAERRRRLVTRHLLDGAAGRSPEDVTDALVVLHSSDPLTPVLAVLARSADATPADVEAALYERRTLWRGHAMRRTLWVAPRDLVPALHAGTTARVAAVERRRTEAWLAEAGVPDPAGHLRAVGDALVALLDDGVVRATREITDALPALQHRLRDGAVSLGSRLLLLEAFDGRLVRTAPAGDWTASQYGWTTPDAWFGEVDDVRPDPADGRATLLHRWLAASGPATTEDLTWWTGWTKRDTVAALAAVGAVEVTLADGTGWVLPDDLADTTASDAPTVALLPGLDPSLMAHKERRFLFGDRGRFGDWLFDRNGNAGPCVVVDGAVVGGWATDPDGVVVHDATTHVDLVDAAAAALTERLGGRVLRPRFPTPSSRSLGSPA